MISLESATPFAFKCILSVDSEKNDDVDFITVLATCKAGKWEFTYKDWPSDLDSDFKETCEEIIRGELEAKNVDPDAVA